MVQCGEVEPTSLVLLAYHYHAQVCWQEPSIVDHIDLMLRSDVAIKETRAHIER